VVFSLEGVVVLVVICYVLYASIANIEVNLKKQQDVYERDVKTMVKNSSVSAGFGVYVKHRPETAMSVNMNILRYSVFMMRCLKD
jgi:hypothetical protein